MFCGDYAQGTIFPAPNFNPIMDAQMLGGALQEFGCDKDMLIGILTQRCNAQRQMIAEAYQSMYGRLSAQELLPEVLGRPSGMLGNHTRQYCGSGPWITISLSSPLLLRI